jgi:hypothetical protein
VRWGLASGSYHLAILSADYIMLFWIFFLKKKQKPFWKIIVFYDILKKKSRIASALTAHHDHVHAVDFDGQPTITHQMGHGIGIFRLFFS